MLYLHPFTYLIIRSCSTFCCLVCDSFLEILCIVFVLEFSRWTFVYFEANCFYFAITKLKLKQHVLIQRLDKHIPFIYEKSWSILNYDSLLQISWQFSAKRNGFYHGLTNGADFFTQTDQNNWNQQEQKLRPKTYFVFVYII